MRRLWILLSLLCLGARANELVVPTTPPVVESFGFSQGAGTFTQLKYFKFLSKPIASTGLFVVNQQDVLWQTSSPVFSQVLIKPAAIHRRLALDKSYQILVQDSQINQLLSALLTGNISEQDWQITAGENGCFKLLPKQQQMSQIFGHVSLCKNSDVLREVTLIDPQGNKTTIEMTLKKTQLTPQELLSLELQ